ncbi:MAG: DUF4032 domain-containing protein, partial [Actinomycetota bacterium]
TGDRPIPAAVAAARWLADVYEPAIESIPQDFQSRLEPAELFHHLLEHRYYLSERLGRGVATPEALADYLDNVLTAQPAERQLQVGEEEIPGESSGLAP